MPPRKQKVVDEDDDVIDLTNDQSSPIPSKSGNEAEKASGNPGYLVELAKSGRAECKRCDGKIEHKAIRIGVILEGDWGLFTRWQHLHCTIFHHSLQSAEQIEGFQDLSEDHKAEIRERFEASKLEEDEDMKPLDPDDLVRKTWREPMEPCSDLLMPLLPYQKEGLGWLVNQEKSDIRGGILADEMGMGKTIQAIALMLQHRPDWKDKALMKHWEASDVAHGCTDKHIKRCGTLIVLPTIAIRQWQMEIARFTKEGTLKVKVYHGSDRNTTVEDLVNYDVIITSYKILEIEYRKATAGTKVECRICGKKFYPEKLRAHRKYFCGESAQRTAAQSKTEKKRARTGSSSASSSKKKTFDSSESEDSFEEEDSASEDQKKGKAKGKASPAVGKAKATPSKTKTTSASASKKKLLEESDEDSEEEVVVQKGKLKKEPVSKKGSASSAKKKPVGKKKAFSESSDDFSSEEEAPQRVSKASSSKLKTPTGKKKLTPKKRKAADSEEDADYFKQASSAEDSESDNSDFVASKKKKTVVAKKGGKSTPSASAKKKGKGKGKVKGDEDDDFEDDEALMAVDDDEMNAEVEHDIREALKAHEKQMKKNAPKSILHLISWFRIILDEAHLIKDRSTSTSKSVFNLISIHKWCLTGTPLQNRVGELYSLIRFLRIDPFAYYYCRSKDCNCKSLHYRFTNSRCDDCHHSVIQHYCHFNKHILNPIHRSGYVAEGRKAMLKLKNQVLDEILLRRTKINRADDIQLPMRVVRVRQEKLDEKEEDFYQALYTQSQAQFNTYLAQGTVLNNYAHIFDILIRLRQAVDHPYLVIHSESQGHRAPVDSSFARDLSTTAATPSGGSRVEYTGSCNLCQDPVEDGVSAGCGHVFCRTCIMDYINTVSSGNSLEAEGSSGRRGASSKAVVTCPDCQEPLTLQLDDNTDNNDNDNHHQLTNANSVSVWDEQKHRKKSILQKVDLDLFQTSTKMEALMEELHKMQKKDVGAKAIVFSQFVNMLDLLEYRIEKGGISCVKLLGSMNLEQRDKVVNRFKEDPDVKVLLISLKAGGVALNLTVASYIFLMDPWWNPAAEMQAIDRTHRIGQFKPIFATRFIIENTIEERILKLQEKKKLVFDGTVGGDAGSMTKLTVDDMRFLFH